MARRKTVVAPAEAVVAAPVEAVEAPVEEVVANPIRDKRIALQLRFPKADVASYNDETVDLLYLTHFGE